MYSFSVTYTCKFQLSIAPEYKFSECGKCFNSKTGRQIKQVVNNSCIGYSIRGKFKSLTCLRTKLEKIKTESCPF